MKCKTSGRVVYSCRYQVVWCTKYRRKVLTDAAADRLREVLTETAAQQEMVIDALEIAPDYVRLSLEVTPQLGIHRAVKLLKATSSRILRQEFDQLRSRIPTLWTNAYFVCTGGGSPDAAIRRYLEDQKKV